MSSGSLGALIGSTVNVHMSEGGVWLGSSKTPRLSTSQPCEINRTIKLLTCLVTAVRRVGIFTRLALTNFCVVMMEDEPIDHGLACSR